MLLRFFNAFTVGEPYVLTASDCLNLSAAPICAAVPGAKPVFFSKALTAGLVPK